MKARIMCFALVAACGGTPARESHVSAVRDPFAGMPSGAESCTYVRPGAAAPRHRDALRELSVANAMAWLDGVVAWAEVRSGSAWRAEAQLAGDADDFAEGVGAVLLEEPWDGTCIVDVGASLAEVPGRDCARRRMWRIGPRTVGVGVGAWDSEESSDARVACTDLRSEFVEQGGRLDEEGGVLRHRIAVSESEIIESRQLSEDEIPTILETAMAPLPPNVTHEWTPEGAWLVRRVSYDDMALEAEDERFRREALLRLAQAERPRPVERIRVEDPARARHQLRLWVHEAKVRPAAIPPLLQLVARIAEEHPAHAELLEETSIHCIELGQAPAVLPWLEAFLRDAPDDADRLYTIRRWAVLRAEPDRLPGLLEDEGVTRRGELAARMLAGFDNYEAAEAAWRISEALPTDRLRRASGRLPLATLTETLAALLDAPGEPMRAVYFRIDAGEGLPPGGTGAGVFTWPSDNGDRRVAMVPPFNDVADSPYALEGFAGSATITVALGDETGVQSDGLSVRGRCEGGDFIVERASRRYDWDAVARFIGRPLTALSRRLFPRPDYRFAADAEEQAQLLERARADEGIACASEREGEFHCAVPPERISARRSMVDLVRPLLGAR